MAFRRTEWVLLASTIAYILAFLGYFILISNREFMGYIATMVLLVALVGWMVLVHLAGSGELTILKYDQVVHFYGFGVTAWLLWYLLDRNFPPLRGKKTIYIFPALASMGLGAMNEIVEFTAVMTVPDTNVGGYYNTALDLVANGSGAVVAMIVITLWPRSSPAVP
jgi:uncharacterized membrane protein YjdF